MKKISTKLNLRLLNYSLIAGGLITASENTLAQTTISGDGFFNVDFEGNSSVEFRIDLISTNFWVTAATANIKFFGSDTADWPKPYALNAGYDLPTGGTKWIPQKYSFAYLANGNFSGTFADKYLAVKFGASQKYGWVKLSFDGTTLTIHSTDYGDSPPAPLPVELISFNARVIQNSVQLNWQTATEVDNYGFSVERSTKLNTTNNVTLSGVEEWKEVGFVNGHGNSNSPKSYSFTDDNPESGKIHYRLKQIDNDGKFEYSDVVSVDLGTPNKFALNQNYPNPFNPTTAIAFTLAESGFVNLTVYNTLGEKVAVLINQQMEAGNYQQDFNAEGLSSGTYIYKITVDDKFTAEKKMLVLK